MNLSILSHTSSEDEGVNYYKLTMVHDLHHGLTVVSLALSFFNFSSISWALARGSTHDKSLLTCKRVNIGSERPKNLQNAQNKHTQAWNRKKGCKSQLKHIFFEKSLPMSLKDWINVVLVSPSSSFTSFHYLGSRRQIFIKAWLI